MIYYMTDSRDRGIRQSAFENPGPYIPIRTAHTDRLIRTASYGPTFRHNKITSVFGPNVFIENKAVKKGIKCNLMSFINENVTSMMLNDLLW